MHIIAIKGRRFKFESIEYISYSGIAPNEDTFDGEYRDTGNAIARIFLANGVEVILNAAEATAFLKAYDDLVDETSGKE